jgi:hypothetical protein
MSDLSIPLSLPVEIADGESLEVHFLVEPMLYRKRIAWKPVLAYIANQTVVDTDEGRRYRSRQAAIRWLWERREEMYCADPRFNKKGTS